MTRLEIKIFPMTGHWGKIVFKADVGQDESNLVNVIFFFISREHITTKNNLFEHMGVEMRYNQTS